MESEMLLSLIVTVLFGVSDRVSCGNSMMSIILPPTVEVFVERTNRQGFEQKLSMKECMKSGCQTPSLCYLPHPTSCFKFIMCKPGEKGEMYVETMPCGFGTMWQHQEQGRDPVCDRYDLVACPNDKCKTPGMVSYKHGDNHCRTYWECKGGNSVPQCCEKYQRFTTVNETHGACVNDSTCEDVCPLLNDATCQGGGVNASSFPDGNCRTYWDCTSGHQHPVCCPQGEGFNVFSSTCEPDATCLGTCPTAYAESCSIAGTTSYDLEDENCRTYMKCSQQGQADPYCCRPGKFYDVKLKQCVESTNDLCKMASCPLGYKEECRLGAIPNDPSRFKMLDSAAEIIMPCSVGTEFNPTLCQCVMIKKTSAAKPAGCTLAIHFVPPDLKNKGTAQAALLMIGGHGQGERGVGNMTNVWTGRTGINIPFYGSQSLWDFYLCLLVQPKSISIVKQVLLSSCFKFAEPDALSLEVSMQGGQLSITVTTNLGENFNATTPYDEDKQLKIQLVRKGLTVGVFVGDGELITFQKTQDLRGNIPIDISGLRFGHCRNNPNSSGFVGVVNDVKFSKCVLTKHEALLSPPLVPVP
ncbi:uncharacterized protein LOC128231955 isoform X3 [Mya arenaria]|uniref:uncharacterized protein LOC128231955 isoform X3 n=1 Tax=Mya arenaria TaxID=6604 RepID=UPI0022E369B7|nr:uncharacterized protein LOC128231955 isoform X3 [Mya arenaria]